MFGKEGHLSEGRRRGSKEAAWRATTVSGGRYASYDQSTKGSAKEGNADKKNAEVMVCQRGAVQRGPERQVLLQKGAARRRRLVPAAAPTCSTLGASVLLDWRTGQQL